MATLPSVRYVPCCPHCDSQRIAAATQDVIYREVALVAESSEGISTIAATGVVEYGHNAESSDIPWYCLACNSGLHDEELILQLASPALMKRVTTRDLLIRSVTEVMQLAELQAAQLGAMAVDSSDAAQGARAAATALSVFRPFVQQILPLLAGIEAAEAFIAGFEDDPSQDGIEPLLFQLRGPIAVLGLEDAA